MKKNRPPAALRSVAAKPPSGIAVAADALQRKRPAEAERALIGVLAFDPSNADALRLLGVAQHLQGNYGMAVSTLRDALKLSPEDASILTNLGSALRANGDLEGALQAFRQATECSPGLAAAWYNLGKTLKSQTHYGPAREAMERALRIDPGHGKAIVAIGDLMKAQGDIDGATVRYRAALALPAQAPHAWYQLANLKTVRFDATDVVELERALGKPGATDEDKVYLGYALAKALDDLQRPEDSFAALTQANRIKRRKVKWDAAEFSRKISQIDAAFTTPAPRAPDVHLGREVIFVVSLPRSGSTLTEQILAAHPQVEGANELPDLHGVIKEESRRRGSDFPHWVPEMTGQDWQRLGERYLERTQRWRSDRPRFTDKGLSNWQVLGAAVAMLPGAHFVNCRRDPVETCLSCYRQLFWRGNAFTYDLAELGAYWRDYDRLSRAWHERYPERVFDQVYEDLLADPQAQVRRLLGFLDLPYDAACLEFHRTKRLVRTHSAAQVRQPLRRDTARAKRYGAALDPLRAALAGG